VHEVASGDPYVRLLLPLLLRHRVFSSWVGCVCDDPRR
jgi:hypothetical protein